METKATLTNQLDKLSVLSAMEKSLAMIQFDTQGHVIWANDNFSKVMGYETEEIIGLAHRQFCTPEFVSSTAYEKLWSNLRSGQLFQEKIIRVSKDKRQLCFEATYTPVYDEDSKLQGIVKVATDITERENSVNRVAEDLRQMSESLLHRTEEGLMSSQEVASIIERFVNTTNDNLKMLEMLDEQSVSIRSIVRTITEIADQTNLLSLNAAIEAAHAKEYGRGFTVVANEVRRLAKQAKEASSEVNTSLESIAMQVEKMVRSVHHSKSIITDGHIRSNQTMNQFKDIGSAAQLLDQQAQSLTEVL